MRFRHRAASLLCAVATASVALPGSGLATAATTANLVANPSFETNTSSWYGAKGTSLSRVGGHLGGSSVRVTAATAGNAVLNDGPDTVLSTLKGATYTATAYVRTVKPGVPVALRLSEYAAGTVHGRATANLLLGDTAWHKVTVTYVAKTAGSKLGLSVTGTKLAQGRSFDVDTVSLTVKPAVTAVAAPSITAFTAAPSTTQIALSWTAANAARYEVFRTGTAAPVWSGTATGWTMPAEPGTSYSFTLKAIGTDGTAVTSSPLSATTPAAAPVVDAFTAELGSPAHSAVVLDWAARNATRYEVYRTGVTAPVYSGTATDFTFQAAGSTSYTFTLKAFSASGQVATSSPATVTTDAKPTGWTRIYRNDFVDMRDVNPFSSNLTANDAIRSTDTTNSQLQKPTVRSNTELMADPEASDGKAIGVWTRKASYNTSTGTKFGWANGRMGISGQNHELPIRITTRVKLTAAAGAKAAVMWWPSGGGWPWEVDFVESFGGKTTTDYWGSRQWVAQRWHADLNGDGMAKEQLIHDDNIDATEYHVYDLFITADRMWIEIDGKKTYETTDKRFIPTGKGFFTVGKALTGARDFAGRTDDAVIVDWLEFSKPAV